MKAHRVLVDQAPVVELVLGDAIQVDQGPVQKAREAAQLPANCDCAGIPLPDPLHLHLGSHITNLVLQYGTDATGMSSLLNSSKASVQHGQKSARSLEIPRQEHAPLSVRPVQQHTGSCCLQA